MTCPWCLGVNMDVHNHSNNKWIAISKRIHCTGWSFCFLNWKELDDFILLLQPLGHAFFSPVPRQTWKRYRECWFGLATPKAPVQSFNTLVAGEHDSLTIGWIPILDHHRFSRKCKKTYRHTDSWWPAAFSASPKS